MATGAHLWQGPLNLVASGWYDPYFLPVFFPSGAPHPPRPSPPPAPPPPVGAISKRQAGFKQDEGAGRTHQGEHGYPGVLAGKHVGQLALSHFFGCDFSLSTFLDVLLATS